MSKYIRVWYFSHRLVIKLRLVCSHQSLCCLLTQSMDVVKVSDQNLGLQYHWIPQHEHLNETFAHI